MTLEQEAIEFFLKEDVLKFGDFTLKSGRKSPYFFNTGSLCSATQLAKLGELYAKKLVANRHLRMLRVFGSAYKGIPIAVATAIALANTNRSRSVRSATARKPRHTAMQALSSA